MISVAWKWKGPELQRESHSPLARSPPAHAELTMYTAPPDRHTDEAAREVYLLPETEVQQELGRRAGTGHPNCSVVGLPVIMGHSQAP